jgi:hypothetical protein
LQPGEKFYAVLFDTPNGFDRRDYSAEAWEDPPEDYFSYWQSRVPQKQEKKRLFVNNDIMVDLMLRLADREEAVKQHFRFVLSLILMRKRLLKYEQTVHQDGVEYWHMRLTRDQSIQAIMNPRMTDDQIAAVSAELGAILHGDATAFERFDADAPAMEADAATEDADTDVE